MSVKRIFVTGAAGRLGSAICRRLEGAYDLAPLDRSRLDLSKSIKPQLPPGRIDWIINSGALTSVDQAENAKDLAFRVNGEAVGELAAAARERGARLLQISTDYIFDGNTDELRREDEPPNPQTVYGESKLLGEHLALETDPNNLVVRVSWVFGPDRPAFPELILRRALCEEHVEAVSDKISSPSYAPDLADWIASLIEAEHTSGIYQLSNSGKCSWQEYGQEVLDAAREIGLPLKTHRVHPVLMKDLPAFKIVRPRFTEMSLERFIATTGIQPRSWRLAVREHVQRTASAYEGDKMA